MTASSALANDRPNIVLIVADQWRGDCLGSAGHGAVETPHLDELFLQGVRFDRAYTACPTCIPARASLLTGMTQRSHGRVGYQDRVPWPYPNTLPRAMADAGYHTHCTGKMHVHPPRSLMGFHSIDLHDGTVGANKRMPHDWGLYDDYAPWLQEREGVDADVQDTGLGANSWVVNPWPYAESSHPTNWATTRAIDFLRRRDPGKPFFLNLSYVRPHPPFDPPLHYLQRYADKELPPVPRGDWLDDPEDAARAGLRASFGAGRVRPDLEDEARRAYFALITHIDHQIGRFRMALQRYGVADNTVILFLSDHGELLGDHNRYAKAMPFEGSARIPWVMHLPPSWGPPRTASFDQPVELRDVMPTCCDLAGVEPPESVEGRSVLPLLRGETDWREDLHGEHAFGLMSNQWLTDGREKYCWFPKWDGGRELLFDLHDDPQELHDLSRERSERIAHWRRRMAEELEGREEGYVVNGELNADAQPKLLLDESGWFDDPPQTPCYPLD